MTAFGAKDFLLRALFSKQDNTLVEDVEMAALRVRRFSPPKLVAQTVVLTLLLFLPALRAAEPTTQGFENWTSFDSPVGDNYLEPYVKDGWLGDKPPYLMPRAGFQMGPARIFRREGTPGKEVVAGKYALGIVTASNAVNVLTDCGAVGGSRRTRPEVSAWLRGSGKVRFRVYAYNDQNRAVDTSFIGTFDVAPEWKQYRALYEPDRTQVRRWGVVLEVAPGAAVDIDEVAISTAAAGAAATMPADVPAPVPDSEKVAVAFRAAGAIQVDGRPDESAWQRAEWHSGFLRYQNQASMTPVQAQFAFLFDDANLYFAFVSAETGLTTNGVNPTPRGTWPAGPTVEFFLDPDATRDVYYQFAANILGCTFESLRTDTGWDCDWKAAGAADATRWSLEAAIPFTAWKRARPRPGETWAVNVCRDGPYQGPWAPVGPRYHSPEGFGLLTFGSYGDWWREGFLPASEQRAKELGGRAAAAADPSLQTQLRMVGGMLQALRASAAEAPAEDLDRARFLSLFHGAEQVSILLQNVGRETSWLEAMQAGGK